jgi:DNA-binding MarR family transcriptional regulator
MAQGDRFAELLSRVAREVTNRQSSEVCCGDLTLEQFQTLRAISTSEQSSIGSLSTELHVDLSTMSRNVTVLERNGHLLRARSAEDGRIVLVELTAKGRRALNTLRCGEREVLSDVYDRLPTSERPKVLKALESLSICLEKTGNGEPCCQPAPARKSSS